MKQSKFSEKENDSALPMWRIVCGELGIDLVGRDLSELRRGAKDAVNEKGNRRRDYRFQSFMNGEFQSMIVITPTEGLRDFQRGHCRRTA